MRNDCKTKTTRFVHVMMMITKKIQSHDGGGGQRTRQLTWKENSEEKLWSVFEGLVFELLSAINRHPNTDSQMWRWAVKKEEKKWFLKFRVWYKFRKNFEKGNVLRIESSICYRPITHVIIGFLSYFWTMMSLTRLNIHINVFVLSSEYSTFFHGQSFPFFLVLCVYSHWPHS